jgi:hypothetical protein
MKVSLLTILPLAAVSALPTELRAAQPSEATSMIVGQWATSYNRCVEPTAITVTDNIVTIEQPTGEQAVERIVSVNGNVIETTTEEPRSEQGRAFVYIVQPRKVLIKEKSAGSPEERIVKCERTPRPRTDGADSCQKAIDNAGGVHRLLEQINARLKAIGIDSFLFFKGVVPMPEGCHFTIRIHPDASRLIEKPSRLCRDLEGDRAKPIVALPVDGRLSHSYELLNSREPYDPQFEGCFERAYGVSVWDRILFSIANDTNLPLDAIRLQFPYESCHYFAVWYENGAARSRDAGCISAISVKQTVSVPVGIAAAGVAISPNQEFTLDDWENYLRAQLKGLVDSKISLQSRDDDHVSFTIRGLRNAVIVGGNYWEKVQLSIFAWPVYMTDYKRGEELQLGLHYMDGKQFRVERRMQIRVLAEGFYSGGGEVYPKDEFFTENMEPRFHEELREFANAIAGVLARREGVTTHE